ncbi:MAG: Ig-like domain-containing protein [bacterium]
MHKLIVIFFIFALLIPQLSEGQEKYILMYSLPEGTGLNNPYNIAVDTNIYVADSNNHRILKFSPQGDLIDIIGSWGFQDGQFQNPSGVALDTSGNIYVADTKNHRIQKFSPNGVFLAKWGSKGTGNLQFSSPSSLAVDIQGNIYVSDTENHRIQKLSPDGTLLAIWGSNGDGNGQFRYPEGIGVDLRGNVYVADWDNNRIQKFDSNGKFIRKWGTRSRDEGQFVYPRGVAVDINGNVYVADSGNNRIQKFDADGNLLQIFGTYGNGDGQLWAPRGVAVDANGNICIVDWGNNRIQKLDPNGNFLAKWGIGGPAPNQFQEPWSVALDSSGYIYVADNKNNRIQKLDQFGNFVSRWGTKGIGNGQFNFPAAVATDNVGNVYVADLGNNRVQKFDSNGNFIAKWGTTGPGDGQFIFPAGIAIDSSRNVYVADWGNNRIQKFDSNGNFITKWGSLGGGDGQFDSPRGIAVDSLGNVYVADTSNSRIQKFNSNGNFLAKWGQMGAYDGQFWAPRSIAVDAGGNLYVADWGNHRIQKFDPNGNFIIKWGSEGNVNELLCYPHGIAISPSGNVYVADSGNQCIRVYTRSVGNIAPIAYPKSVRTNEDVPLMITLTGRDPDGNAIFYLIKSQPQNGTLSGSPPNVIYTPNPNFNGTDSFRYAVSDGLAESRAETISITIDAVNDPPVAESQTVTTDEDKSINIILSGSDSDGDTITYIIKEHPEHGSLSGTPPSLTYTPNLEFHGTDSFVFVASDGKDESKPARINITVNAFNDPPIADPQTIKTEEDKPTQIVLTGKDPEGNAITFKIVTQPTNGTLSGDPPNITYTPKPNFFEDDSFTFTTSDGILESSPSTVVVIVSSVNDPPVAENQSVSVYEDTSITIVLSGSDPDGNIITFDILSKPSKGTITKTNNVVVYKPEANFNGIDSFTFVVKDFSLTSDPATVSITVLPVNDMPSAIEQSIITDEDTPVEIILKGIDFDNDELKFKVVNEPTNGKLTGEAPLLTYIPNLNFYGTDVFTFNVSDGYLESQPAKVNITVNPVNDPPIAEPQQLKTFENTPVTITLKGYDLEDRINIYRIITQPSNGTLSGTVPVITYTPSPKFYGYDEFTFRVSDGKADSETVKVVIEVIAVNEPPVAKEQTVITDEDTPVNVTLFGTDPDDDELTFNIIQHPTNGTLSGTAPRLVYTPKADYNGSDSFSYEVSDGLAKSSPANVKIKVNPINDRPIAISQSISIDEDKSTKITLSGTDVDNDILSYIIVTKPSNGKLSGKAPEVVYTPKTDFYGNDSFTFTVNDGKLESEPALVSITINAVNDPPIANAQKITLMEGESTSITLSGSDPENDKLTFKITTQPSYGTLSGTPPNIVYKPKLSFGGNDSFAFIVSDGKSNSKPALVDITVNYIQNPFDVNRDGIVNIIDLVLVRKYFGKSDFPSLNNPDVNRDGKVDEQDILIIVKHFGKTGL